MHRGTPWQTVYLKAHECPSIRCDIGTTPMALGTNTWTALDGRHSANYGQFLTPPIPRRCRTGCCLICSPRGSTTTPCAARCSVNQTHLAAWSALFSGMVALTNNRASLCRSAHAPTYTSIDHHHPAGVDGSTVRRWGRSPAPSTPRARYTNADGLRSAPLTHVGDILSTPALTETFAVPELEQLRATANTASATRCTNGCRSR